MRTRNLALVSALVLSIAALGPIDVAAGGPKKPPKSPPPPPPPSTSSTWVDSYADVRDGVKCDMTPQAIEPTLDKGIVVLGNTAGPGCEAVSWIAKLDAFGNPVWQEEIGCIGLPDGGLDLGLAMQATSDGGYVLAGGSRDCQSNPVCPYLRSIQCGVVAKLDGAGRLLWKRVFGASASTTSIEDIRQTGDGGFIAVGSYIDSESNIGALVLKLDGEGNAQWQRRIGPAGRTHALLNAVQQSADGGFVATGDTYTAIEGLPRTSVFAVALGADGSVRWQRGFNSLDSTGAPTASEHALAITATSDGGSAIAGNWTNTRGPGTCCEGILLLKLDRDGNSQWQRAYSGGVHCFFNGYWTQCVAIGGLAYSVHATADGGFALGGAGHLKLRDSAPLVPWLARTGADGSFVWENFYYQTHTTGRPLSQYFAASTPLGDGYAAVGSSGNPVDLKTELFVVRTDTAGQIGACSQVQPPTPLDVLDPGLVRFDPGLPVATGLPTQGDLPGSSRPTSISTGAAGSC